MNHEFRIEIPGATLVGTHRPGEGTALVLVHGFGGSRHDWELVERGLPAERPLIAYDLRGFGASRAEPGEAFSHAEDLLALLDDLGIAQADLCGLSLGGGTVLNFALDHPARVRRLVLVSPMLVGWSWTESWIEQWKAIGRAARAGDIAAARELWWRHPLFESTRESTGAKRLREGIANFAGHQWVRDDQRPALPDVDRLTQLHVPTLLLTGSRDTEDFRLMADLVAGAGEQVTRIDHHDAGHLLNLEIPEAIAREIAAFL